jgi:acetylglutamate kinase
MTGPYDRETTIMGLLRALPYIRLFKGRVFVVKLGGTACSDATILRQVVEQVSVLTELGIRVVLVHGGGSQATALAERLGIESRFIDGRRVTSPKLLEVVTMTVNGTVSTAILAACRGVGLKAVAVSGVAAGLVRARVRPPVVRDGASGSETVDYGEVGDVVSVDAEVLERLMAAGFVPVVSPIGADDSGRVLNINADTVAAALASALEAEKLVFLTDAPGILEDRRDPGSLVSYIDLTGLEAMLSRGSLEGGMLPKVTAARAALGGGVSRVHLVGIRQKAGLLVEVFTNDGAGTLIVRSINDLAPTEQGDAAAAQGGAS